MTIVYTIAGWLLLAVVLADFGYTTISANKIGALTRRSASIAWSALSTVAGSPSSRMQRASGPIVMSAVGLVWILLTSLAWTLIFRGEYGALQEKASKAPAGWAETWSFVGSAVSTMGASRVEAASTGWDILAMTAAVNGMVVLTLSVSFVLNVTQTVTEGRSFHLLIAAFDPSKREHASDIVPALSQLCARVRSAPLALYYSAARPERSLPATIRYFTHAVARDPELFPLYCHALAELPWLDAYPETDRDTFIATVDKWSAQFTLDRTTPPKMS